MLSSAIIGGAGGPGVPRARCKGACTNLPSHCRLARISGFRGRLAPTIDHPDRGWQALGLAGLRSITRVIERKPRSRTHTLRHGDAQATGCPCTHFRSPTPAPTPDSRRRCPIGPPHAGNCPCGGPPWRAARPDTAPNPCRTPSSAATSSNGRCDARRVNGSRRGGPVHEHRSRRRADCAGAWRGTVPVRGASWVQRARAPGATSPRRRSGSSGTASNAVAAGTSIGPRDGAARGASARTATLAPTTHPARRASPARAPAVVSVLRRAPRCPRPPARLPPRRFAW